MRLRPFDDWQAVGEDGCDSQEIHDNRFAGIADLFYQRWEYCHHPIHSLAHVLHPDHNQSNPLADASVCADVDTMLKRYYSDASDRAAAHTAIRPYLSRQGHFSELDSEGDVRMIWQTDFITQSRDWWQSLVQVEPVVATLAIRVLQIAITSSACERQFSKWGFIVTKYRTRLSLSRQHKLVYCSSNWKLLEGYDEDKWYRSDSEDEYD